MTARSSPSPARARPSPPENGGAEAGDRPGGPADPAPLRPRPMVDGVGESPEREILTASPDGVPIGKTLIASPARRRGDHSPSPEPLRPTPAAHPGARGDARIARRSRRHLASRRSRPTRALFGTRDEDSTEGPEDFARGHVASRPTPPR